MNFSVLSSLCHTAVAWVAGAFHRAKEFLGFARPTVPELLPIPHELRIPTLPRPALHRVGLRRHLMAMRKYYEIKWSREGIGNRSYRRAMARQINFA